MAIYQIDLKDLQRRLRPLRGQYRQFHRECRMEVSLTWIYKFAQADDPRDLNPQWANLEELAEALDRWEAGEAARAEALGHAQQAPAIHA